MTSMTLITQRNDRQKPAAPIGQDGQVVDVPEVAIAKAKHLTLHARAVATATSDYELDAYEHAYGNLLYPTSIRLVSPIAYRGPPAPLGPDGQVVDTPEMLMARATHMKVQTSAVAFTADSGC